MLVLQEEMGISVYFFNQLIPSISDTKPEVFKLKKGIARKKKSKTMKNGISAVQILHRIGRIYTYPDAHFAITENIIW